MSDPTDLSAKGEAEREHHAPPCASTQGARLTDATLRPRTEPPRPQPPVEGSGLTGTRFPDYRTNRDDS